MTAEQIQGARSASWRQKDDPILTLEDAQSWLQKAGVCLFLPRRAQIAAPAPSFVEACLGAANATPPRAAIETATGLLVRLCQAGSVIPLNLLGTPGEQPDFLATPETLPYIFALRGEKDWKREPHLHGSGKVSPLVLEVWRLLEQKGGLTANAIKDELGREVTEAAVLRALHELWQHLRVIPMLQAGDEPAIWEPLAVRFRKALNEGGNVSQVTALSVLVASYLQSAVAATSEEAEAFLSPLASRSRVREVIRGLTATRQILLLPIDAQTLLYIEDTLPEFEPVPEPVAPPVPPALPASAPFAARRSFAGPPSERPHARPSARAGRPPASGPRKDFGDKPRWKPREGAAPGGRQDKPRWTPREGAGPRAAGDRPAWRRTGPGEERPAGRRSESGAGGDRPRWKSGDKPGSGKSGFKKPGFGKPGFNKPGFSKPGFSKPGSSRPGSSKPGSSKPGFSKPGASRPSFGKRAADAGGEGGRGFGEKPRWTPRDAGAKSKFGGGKPFRKGPGSFRPAGEGRPERREGGEGTQPRRQGGFAPPRRSGPRSFGPSSGSTETRPRSDRPRSFGEKARGAKPAFGGDSRPPRSGPRPGGFERSGPGGGRFAKPGFKKPGFSKPGFSKPRAPGSEARSGADAPSPAGGSRPPAKRFSKFGKPPSAAGSAGPNRRSSGPGRGPSGWKPRGESGGKFSGKPRFDAKAGGKFGSKPGGKFGSKPGGKFGSKPAWKSRKPRDPKKPDSGASAE